MTESELAGIVLEVGYLERWCREHGTLARLEEIRRSIPPLPS